MDAVTHFEPRREVLRAAAECVGQSCKHALRRYPWVERHVRDRLQLEGAPRLHAEHPDFFALLCVLYTEAQHGASRNPNFADAVDQQPELVWYHLIDRLFDTPSVARAQQLLARVWCDGLNTVGLQKTTASLLVLSEYLAECHEYEAPRRHEWMQTRDGRLEGPAAVTHHELDRVASLGTLSCLPPELVAMIFALLPAASLRVVGSVSRAFYLAAKAGGRRRFPDAVEAEKYCSTTEALAHRYPRRKVWQTYAWGVHFVFDEHVQRCQQYGLDALAPERFGFVHDGRLVSTLRDAQVPEWSKLVTALARRGDAATLSSLHDLLGPSRDVTV